MTTGDDFSALGKAVKASSTTKVGKGCSEAQIAKAQEELNITFPSALREYLRRFGWLSVASQRLYGLGRGSPAAYNLVRNTRWYRDKSGRDFPEQLLPLLNDGAGNLYCVSSVDGTIRFWDHEADADERPEFVCGSLARWLINLIEEKSSPPPSEISESFSVLAANNWQVQSLSQEQRMRLAPSLAELLSTVEDESRLRDALRRITDQDVDAASPSLRAWLIELVGRLIRA